jgi:hypothetical protein
MIEMHTAINYLLYNDNDNNDDDNDDDDDDNDDDDEKFSDCDGIIFMMMLVTYNTINVTSYV